jgi:electron transfer flavoprotein beta subunit
MKINGKKMRAERVVDDGYEQIEAKLPVLLTVLKELTEPGYPSVNGIVSACLYDEDAIKVWNAADIKADAMSIGLQGSATWVTKTFSPETKRKGMKLSGTSKEIAEQLIKELHAKNLVQ